MVFNQNILIVGSKQEFLTKLVNPKTINDETNKQKSYFNKLKFQYLEQETRDKFLRILLNNESIDNTDLNDIQGENQHIKQRLKDLKTQMNDKQSDINEVTNEILELHNNFENKLSQTNEILTRISEIETQINNETIDHELLNDIDITKFNNFDTYLQFENNKLNSDRNKLNQINDDIKYSKVTLGDQQKVINELTPTLQDLILTARNTSGSSDYNNLGKWINEIIKILNNFCNITFDVQVSDFVNLKFGDYFVTLDKQSLNLIDTNCDINKRWFNSGDKIGKLLELLVKYT